MMQYREAVMKRRYGVPTAAGTRRADARPKAQRRRVKNLAGPVLAGVFALAAIASPARADAGDVRDALWMSGGKLNGSGTELQVRVSYQCEEGQTAGVGIFLSQADSHGATASGGAGSGQRPCKGGTEHVTLTVNAGSAHFHPGCAAVTVSVFISGPGSQNRIEQLADEVRLRR